MSSRTYNPEKRAWRGRSHKAGGVPVRALREASAFDALLADTAKGVAAGDIPVGPDAPPTVVHDAVDLLLRTGGYRR